MQVARMSQVLKKFQGCLVGALLGDVLGEKFEGLYDEPIHMSTVTAYTMDSVPSSPKKSPLLSYTDDTAMTRAICRSLVERKTYDNRDMAEKFVEEYFNEPDRGYGAGVTTVFRRLRDEKPADETLPAKDQFDGMGSYGNGAAMRISPVALYAKDYDSLVKVTYIISRPSRETLTVAHRSIVEHRQYDYEFYFNGTFQGFRHHFVQ